MSTDSHVVVLVGAKGVGKSAVGRALAKGPRVHFVEAEAIAKRVLDATGGVIDEAYARAALAAIVEAIHTEARRHRVVVVETTGASRSTGWMLEQLRAHHRVHLVRLRAPSALCLQRIAERDANAHVPVDSAMVEAIHRASEALDWDWDLVVDTAGTRSPEDIAREIATRVVPDMSSPG